MQSVPPRNLEKVLEYLRQGRIFYVQTPLRTTIINKKCLEKFEKAGLWLLKEEGDGYRLNNGKSSVYLFPVQLTY